MHLSTKMIFFAALRLASSLLLLLILTSCSTSSNHPRDPYEPVNRVVYRFNDKADQWVMKPIAQTYHDYSPQFIRSGVHNFFSNLNDANSAVNYALQGEGKSSLHGFSRFAINSTIGILGLFDIAPQQSNYRQTGFGDTFSVWGWKNSNYVVMPLLGSSTVRDTTGVFAGVAFRENTLYSNPHEDAKLLSSTIEGIDVREKFLGMEDTLDDAALDPYSYMRDAYLQIRAKRTGDALPQADEEEFDIDALME